MKKILLSIVALAVSLAAIANTQDHDDPHGNGTRLNFRFGITGAYFMGNGEDKTDGEGSTIPGMTYGMEVGTKWTIHKFNEQMGIGIVVDWINIEAGFKTEDTPNGTYGSGAIDFGFLEVGPSFTYSIDDKLAFDTYYQLQPTVFAAGATGDDSGDFSNGFGFTHAIGFAARYGIFTIGYEPNFGAIEVENVGVDATSASVGKVDVNTTRHTIIVGFKF